MTAAGSWIPPRSSVAAWATYDLANTVFALGVGGLYLPEWVIDINGREDLQLALAINAAMVAIILLAPWLGARSDHFGRRRPYLIGATAVAVSTTFFLATVGVTASLVLFSLALVGFHIGSLFYDSLLPDVSTPENRGRISGLGVGVGYIGSFIAVATGRFILDVLDLDHAAVFRTVAVLFLLFALPAFFFIRERPRRRKAGSPPGPGRALGQVVVAWRRAARYPGVVRFLVGRFFYSDAINTLIGGFLTVFALEEVGFERSELEVLLGVAILASIAGGLGGGRLTDVLGPRRMLNLALYTWMAAWIFGLVAAAAEAKPLGAMLMVMGGLALGTTWSADRAYMARISPPAHLGEFYGLYATVGRFATILGPLLWGITVSVLDQSRTVAMLILLGFLVVARVILQGVDDRERDWTRAEATER